MGYQETWLSARNSKDFDTLLQLCKDSKNFYDFDAFARPVAVVELKKSINGHKQGEKFLWFTGERDGQRSTGQMFSPQLKVRKVKMNIMPIEELNPEVTFIGVNTRHIFSENELFSYQKLDKDYIPIPKVVTQQQYEMLQKIQSHSPTLKQNQGYFILDESESRAVGFSPTAPDKIVIWNKYSDGDGYENGHYGSTLNVSELADLKFLGIDIDKVVSILNDIGFDYKENQEQIDLEQAENSLEQTGTIEVLCVRQNGPIYSVVMLDTKNREITLGKFGSDEQGAKQFANQILENASKRSANIKYVGESVRNLFFELPEQIQIAYENIQDNGVEWLTEQSIIMESSYFDDGYFNGYRYSFTNTLTGQNAIYDCCLSIGEQHNTGLRDVLEIIGINNKKIDDLRDNYHGFLSKSIYDADLFYNHNNIKNDLLNKLTGLTTIEINEYTGTWSSIDQKEIGGNTYYLMENDKYGDETECLIINSKQEVITTGVYNGFEEDSFTDDLVDYWHTHDTGNTLREFLGMNEEEYQQWGAPDILTQMQEVKLKSYTETYSSVESISIGDMQYHIMLNDIKNIDVPMLIVNSNLEVICETNSRTFTNKEFVDALSAVDGIEFFFRDYKDTIMGQLDEMHDNSNISDNDFSYLRENINELSLKMRLFLESNPDTTLDTELSHLSSLIFENIRDRDNQILSKQALEEDIPSAFKEPTNRKTIYVCSPLAGEIQENIQKARQYSKFVAEQGGTPLAPHITELFNDTIPEERELGLKMGIDYLKKSDEIWVFGNRISNGMANEIRIAQDELHIPIYHVDENTLEKSLFSEWEKSEERMNDLANPKARTNKKENFTQDQLARAKDVDLLNYVQTHGYTVKPHGSCYKLIEDGHDSTVIFPSTNSWSNMASGIGGDTVSFLVKHENKNMVDAVKELIGETFDPQKMFVKNKPQKELPQRELQLPPHAENNNRVFAYLIKSRGLDRDIVKKCIDDGLLYQGEIKINKGDKNFKFDNCVFVGKDDKGVPKSAMLRSVNDNESYGYKGNATGTDRSYAFIIEGKPNAQWLTICESPIEILSKMTLQKMKNQTTDDEHFLSLNGISDKNPRLMIEMIDRFLSTHENVRTINIALNNDKNALKSDGTPDVNHGVVAGNLLKQEYSDKYLVVDNYPKLKDYNLELKREIIRKNQPVIDIPEQAPNNNRAFMHLTQTKKLDKDIVNGLLNDGSVYQADKTILDTEGNPKTFSNTIFVQKDETGTPVYAISVNYNASQEKADFKAEYKNEEQARSYLSHKGDSNDLLVFNNPISMLSHQTYMKEQGIENHNNYICCISNPCEAINQFILNYPNIKDVKVMLDRAVSINPKTKQPVDFREFSYNKIKKAVTSKKVSVSKKFAKGIDLNRDLQSIKCNEKSSRKEKSIENDVENER